MIMGIRDCEGKDDIRQHVNVQLETQKKHAALRTQAERGKEN